MICPNCLANNKKNANRCQNCGFDFTNSDFSIDQHAPEENEEYADEAEQTDIENTITITRIERNPEGMQPDMHPYHNHRQYENPATTIAGIGNEKLRKKAKAKRVFYITITILVWALILAAIVLLAIFGVKWVKQQLAGPDVSTPPVVKATPSVLVAPNIIVQTDDKGNEYLQCTFFGKVGDSIYLTITDDFYPFQSESLQINLGIPDIVSESANLENDTISFNLGAYYRMNSGVMAEMETPTQTLKVPQTQISIISPSTLSYEIYQNSFDVVFKVTPGSMVYINDLNYSDKVDANGKGRYTANLEPGATANVNLVVKAPYHRSAEANITISRPALDVPLTLAGSLPKTVTANSGDFPNTRSLTIRINGTIDKEAALSIPDYEVKSLNINTVNGTYEAEVVLPNYGRHTIYLIAQHPTKGTSKLAYNVLYNPNENDYTRRAWVYDKKITTNPEAFNNKIFLLENVEILEVLDTETTMFRINMGTQEDPQWLVIEYFGTKTINKGDKIRIFGDVQGRYQDTTKVVARFIYSAQ